MSTISTFQSLTCSIFKSNNLKSYPHKNYSFAIQLHKNAISTHNSRLAHGCKLRRIRSADEDAQIPETEEAVADEEASPSPSPEQNVAIPVSPSDKLLMFFQAEGTLTDSAIPNVTQALEGTEGVSNLKVRISEGIASVELTKQTTIQAAGVASSLLEAIQGAGFKLQTLNLSFEDEELLVGV
ncbi:Transaldolase [Bienertia sinuspersici]